MRAMALAQPASATVSPLSAAVEADYVALPAVASRSARRLELASELGRPTRSIVLTPRGRRFDVTAAPALPEPALGVGIVGSARSGAGRPPPTSRPCARCRTIRSGH